MRLKKPKFWDYKEMSLWSILLYPLSVIYLLLVWLSRIPYIFKGNKNPFPIICVGNIYVGGTGKTPLAAEIFNILKLKGKKPSFIKKHYDYLLDEIKMLKEIGNTYYAKNRSTAIGLSILNGNNVAILDDGFQDFSIKPDFSILCFNSKQLIGNGCVIPSGPLRERLSATLRADCIVINGGRTKETSDFEKKITKNLKGKKLHFFYSKYMIKNIENLKNKEITAFAGIGNPSNFFDLLKENKLNIKNTYSFPDHHKYSQADFDKIASDKLTKIFTTKKDYFRLDDKQKQICDYVDIKLEIENKKELENLIENSL
tara:strand:- start:1558 stop:2499 length:942 start_codon:yes stop_codon:yes gene_type:complete